MTARSVLAVLLIAAAPVAAQEPGRLVRLTLDAALGRAIPESETVAIARAAVRRARGEQRRARSERFPQVTASASYTRLLDSQFGGFADAFRGDSAGPSESCRRFAPDPLLPIAARLDSLEASVRCLSSANPFGAFSDLPFGREHTYSVGLGLTQTLWSGGRIRGLTAAAAASRTAADVALSSAEAALVLEVVQAYYDAALADRLLEVAEATLAQADTAARQTALRREVGTAPEFDLLRARVARANQMPVVIQRRSERDLALLRLKQLMGLPDAVSIELVSDLTDLDPASLPALASMQDAGPAVEPAARAPVRQAAAAVEAQEALLRSARALRWPTLVLGSQYAKLAYPGDGLPTFSGYLTNWNVSLGLQVPLFTGGRLGGEMMIAESNLEEARLRHRQALKLATLDTRRAADAYEAARAAWEAGEGTTTEATRAHAIAQVRYEEGIGTQTELLDARIALQQSEWNRARAARDLHVARLRLALLEDLPFATGVGATAAGLTAPPTVTRQAPAPLASQAAFPGTGVP